MESVESDYVVADENWAAWRLFCDVSTQWRYFPMGGPQGIDYPCLESAMRMIGVRNRGEMFRKVKLIEHGAMARFRDMTLRDLYGE